MAREFLPVKSAPFGILVVLLVTLTSCGVEAMAGLPRAWIDVPRDGAEVSADAALNVISHAYAREGVAEIMLSVNGEPYTREPPAEPGASFTQITQQWFPPGPGQYTLQARAYDAQGQMSNAASVRITVVGESPALILTPGEAPTATHTPTGGPTDTPTSTGVPTDTPTHTPTSTPTGTATTSPRPTILRFSASPSSIERGQCARLTWEVASYPTAIYLDGEGVGNAPDFRDKCPTSTTTYTLRAVGAGGESTATVQVEVRQPPADTTGPAISGITESADPIKWHAQAYCPPSQVTISAHVTDPSGVSQVKVTYRVADMELGREGAWRELTMGQMQGDTYSATITRAHLNGSLYPPIDRTQCPICDNAILDYYLQAFDGAGNRSQSAAKTVTIWFCETAM